MIMGRYSAVLGKLVIENEKRVPSVRDLRKVVKQGGVSRLVRVVVGVKEVDVVGAKGIVADGHRNPFIAGVGYTGDASCIRAPARSLFADTISVKN